MVFNTSKGGIASHIRYLNVHTRSFVLVLRARSRSAFCVVLHCGLTGRFNAPITFVGVGSGPAWCVPIVVSCDFNYPIRPLVIASDLLFILHVCVQLSVAASRVRCCVDWWC